ncbi:MAG: zf-HC2 domain-containing protein [Terriglobales bacterium]
MDHDMVVRQKMTERYLLNELDPQARDEFEEHYFACPDCAADVHAGALFVDQSKIALESVQGRVNLSASPAASPRRLPIPVAARSGWFGWLRPVFVVPVLALLLAVIGYQDRANRILQQTANSPQVLASAVVNVGVRGAEPISIPVRAGQAFELSLNVPPEGRFSSYKLDLYSAQGKLEWSRTISASGGGTLSLYIPGSVPGNDHRPDTLAVYGISARGVSQDLGRYPIELQDGK